MSKMILTTANVSLDVFAASVWGYADRTSDLKAAFAEAIKGGNDLDTVKRTFRDVWVAYILAKGSPLTDTALVEGRRVNDLKGAKPDGGDDRRNPVQEKAYVAAKVALGAALRACGISADGTRSDAARATRAARQTDGTKDASDAASKVESAVPVFANANEFDAYMSRMAAMLDATARRNAEHVRAARLAPILTGFREYNAE